MLDMRSLEPLSVKVNEDGTLHYRGLIKFTEKSEQSCAIVDIPRMKINMEEAELSYSFGCDGGNATLSNATISLLTDKRYKGKAIFTINTLDIDECKKIAKMMLE